MIARRTNRKWLVGLNAQLLSGQHSYRRAGIHTYIAQQLNHLPQNEADLDFVVFTNNTQDLNPFAASLSVGTRWPTSNRIIRILWEQSAFPLTAVRRGIDLVHGMAFVSPVANFRPSIVTVYDLSFIYYPDRYPMFQRLYLSSQTRRSCRSARHVVTISESSRQDVHRLFAIPLENISVIYPGVDAQFVPRPAGEIENFRTAHNLPARFVLHVGTLQPRKSIPTLIKAFARLEDSRIELMLVGGRGWAFEEIFAQVKNLGLEDRVRFTGYVPDDELPLWYNAASVLVFPSVYEGFGLPVTEAMACGTPVVAANTSAIPESAGAAARLFKAQDPSALCEHIATVLDDPDLRAKMRMQGLEQSRQFSWERAGQKLAAIYRQVMDTV